MSITKNVFKLNQVYDLINDSRWITYDPSNDPGQLFVWGSGNYGATGQSDVFVNRSSPVQIPGTTWRQVSAGNRVFGAIKTDGTLWMWGGNGGGQLGINAAGHRSSPVQVPGTNWCFVSADQHTMALKTDGTLWVWGCNDLGQLGNSSSGTPQSSPIQIPGTTWAQVQAISSGSSAIKTDGTNWLWGINTQRRLGMNAYTQFWSSPQQASGTWVDVQIGSGNHGIGKSINGSIATWGDNQSGQLGRSIAPESSTASRGCVCGGAYDWNSIGAGGRHTVATKTDGTLWAWGSNCNGELGVPGIPAGSYAPLRSSPMQVPGNTWAKLDTGSYNTMARKTDSTLWSWGSGGSGRLGHGTSYNVPRSSPVQIPGTTWTSLTASFDMAGAIKAP